MEWAIGLIVVGGAAVAIVLWAMAGGDKRLSQLSISQPRLPSTQIPPQGTRYGYSVWAWKGGAWTMVENL